MVKAAIEPTNVVAGPAGPRFYTGTFFPDKLLPPLSIITVPEPPRPCDRSQAESLRDLIAMDRTSHMVLGTV